MEQLLDMKEAAMRLRITPRLMQKLWDTRQINGVKVGRFVRFTEGNLAEYVARNTQGRTN